jgi:hypothetical protein
MKCFETFKCLEKDGVYLGEITVNEPKFKNQLLDGSNTLLDLTNPNHECFGCFETFDTEIDTFFHNLFSFNFFKKVDEIYSTNLESAEKTLRIYCLRLDKVILNSNLHQNNDVLFKYISRYVTPHITEINEKYQLNLNLQIVQTPFVQTDANELFYYLHNKWKNKYSIRFSYIYKVMEENRFSMPEKKNYEKFVSYLFGKSVRVETSKAENNNRLEEVEIIIDEFYRRQPK